VTKCNKISRDQLRQYGTEVQGFRGILSLHHQGMMMEAFPDDGGIP
jgi:hypothetical protein